MVMVSNLLCLGGGNCDYIGVLVGFGDLDKQCFNVMGVLSYDKIGILCGILCFWVIGYQLDKYLVVDMISLLFFGNIFVMNFVLVSGGVYYVVQFMLVFIIGVFVNGSVINYMILNVLVLQNECNVVLFGVSQM